MNLNQEFDTIAAIATPYGTGGIGVIRISGEKAFDIIGKIFFNPIFKENEFKHGWIIDGDKKIDEVVILPFYSPKSYTGEDVVEIQCHGGVNVVNNILNLVLKNGARIAERGEFTKRAFLNKRMDLSQAEAVADIIHSKTGEFVSISAQNLSGFLRKSIENIRAELFDLYSKIIASIDFPEEVSELEYDVLKTNFESISGKISKILEDADNSNIMRQGVTVVLAGKPNVGKSSVFNCLLNQQRAIVTDIAGTTRDIIKETLDYGIPVTIVDTAGIHSNKEISKVEEIGIEYTKEYIESADLIIFVYDSSQGMCDEDKDIYDSIKHKKHIIVANKSDLANNSLQNVIKVSSKTGEGIDSLKQQIISQISGMDSHDIEYVTNKRQQNCLINSQNYIKNAINGLNLNLPQDLISIDLKSALMALDELTGELITDEVLDNVFEHFCIGK